MAESELPSFQSLLFAGPSLSVQFTLLLVHAAFWFFAIKQFARRVVGPFIARHSWRHQWLRMNCRALEATVGITFPSEQEAWDFCVWFLAVCVSQHMFGALLCLPAVTYNMLVDDYYRGWSEGPVAQTLLPEFIRNSPLFSAALPTIPLLPRVPFLEPLLYGLVCQGALCEAGFEVGDTLERVYKVVTGPPAARGKGPLITLTFAIFHHTCGLAMVLPMNLYYRDNPRYHELVLMLQSAGGITIALRDYGYTRDASTWQGLRELRYSVGACFAIAVWNRICRFSVLCRDVLGDFAADGEDGLMFWRVGVMAAGLMMLFNVALLGDVVQKFAKFWFVVKEPIGWKNRGVVQTAGANNNKNDHGGSSTPVANGGGSNSLAKSEASTIAPSNGSTSAASGSRKQDSDGSDKDETEEESATNEVEDLLIGMSTSMARFTQFNPGTNLVHAVDKKVRKSMPANATYWKRRGSSAGTSAHKDMKLLDSVDIKTAMQRKAKSMALGGTFRKSSLNEKED